MMKHKLNKLNKLKKEIIADTLDNNSLSKFEKLKVITLNDLGWRLAIQQTDIFNSLKQECKNKELDLFGKYSGSDTYFSNRRRGETIYFSDEIDRLFDEYKLDDSIVLVSSDKVEIKKTLSEFIDIIYKFCIRKKIVGFINEW